MYLRQNIIALFFLSQLLTISSISAESFSKQFHSIQTYKLKLTKKIRYIQPNNHKDIVPLSTKHVKPILYTHSISLNTLSIKEKKQNFIAMIIPSILVAKYHLKCDQIYVGKLILKNNKTTKDILFLEKKRETFKAHDDFELFYKMESHPNSIIIAQAIIESGWGTSTLFKKSNNIFGVWSFNSKDKRIPASKKRGKKTIYVKKYNSMEESIYDYFKTLSTVANYAKFREKRVHNKNPYTLIQYLGTYSEEGEIYIQKLENMIKDNHLLRYDDYRLAL